MGRNGYRVIAGLGALGLLAGSVTAAADGVVLRERADGTTVITDAPGEGGARSEGDHDRDGLEGAETAGSPSRPATARPATGPTGSGAAASPADYTVEIRAPEPDAVIWADDARLTVRVAVEPAPAADHRLRITLGEHARTVVDQAGEVDLYPVHRGSYPLTVAVIDGEGEVVATTPPRTIHVKQHSRLHPGTAD